MTANAYSILLNTDTHLVLCKESNLGQGLVETCLIEVCAVAWLGLDFCN